MRKINPKLLVEFGREAGTKQGLLTNPERMGKRLDFVEKAFMENANNHRGRGIGRISVTGSSDKIWGLGMSTKQSDQAT